MPIYHTNKGILAEFSESTTRLHDPIGNIYKCKNAGRSLKEVLDEFFLEPCLLNLGNDLEDACKTFFSDATLILNSDCTLTNWAESILDPLREIEYAASQLVFGKEFADYELELWQNLNVIDEYIRDGHIDSISYEALIAKETKGKVDLLNAYFAFFDIRRLSELIRLEILHAEARLKEAIVKIRNLIIEVSCKKGLHNGKELVYYSNVSDQIGWGIADAIKAVFTSLDALTKLVLLISKIEFKKLSKVPSAYASDLTNFRPNKKNVSAEYVVTFSDSCKFIKPYILLRNELTHNQALHPVRQPIFVGLGTPCINKVELAYGDILSWDRAKEHFSRCQGRIGFFTQKRNAISDTMELVMGSIKLINICIKIIRQDTLKKLEQNNIRELWVIKNHYAGKFYFQKANVSSIMQSILTF